MGEKVSLDYDDVLSTRRGKELVKRLISEGKDVYIVTRRQSTQGADVYNTAKDLEIPRDHVIFTNGHLKWEVIKRHNIKTHYDNNPNELNKIKENVPGVRTIQFNLNF